MHTHQDHIADASGARARVRVSVLHDATAESSEAPPVAINIPIARHRSLCCFVRTRPLLLLLRLLLLHHAHTSTSTCTRRDDGERAV